jgi:hypothetical protein
MKPKPKARKDTAPKSQRKQAGKAKGEDMKVKDKPDQAKPQATHTDQKLKALADAKRPKTTAEKLKDLADAKAHIMSAPIRKPNDRPALDDHFDEREFTALPPKPRPRPLNVDDGGFISPVVTKPKVKASKADTRNTRRSTIMPDRTVNTAAPQIDASSVETFRATTQSAARNLRKSAGKLQEDAAELRRQAQTWIENGENSTAEDLRREAAGMEQDADQRLAAAAGYEDAAASAK